MRDNYWLGRIDQANGDLAHLKGIPGTEEAQERIEQDHTFASYEYEKQKLMDRNLPPEQFEKEIKALAAALKAPW